MAKKTIFVFSENAATNTTTGTSVAMLDKIKAKLKPLECYYNVNNGLRSGIDKVTKKHHELDKKLLCGAGIFVLNRQELAELNINPQGNSLIKPYFKNSDISKYSLNQKSDLYVIYSGKDTDIESFPKIHKHLSKYKKIIEPSRVGESVPWYALVRTRNEKIFLNEKITFPQRSATNTFGYCSNPWYAGSDVFFITAQKQSPFPIKTLLGILCSKTIYYWLYFRGKRKGEMLELIQTPISEIPLPNLGEVESARIEKLVNEIISGGRDLKKESEIERIVATSYGLNAKEQSEIAKFYNDRHVDLESANKAGHKKAA